MVHFQLPSLFNYITTSYFTYLIRIIQRYPILYQSFTKKSEVISYLLEFIVSSNKRFISPKINFSHYESVMYVMMKHELQDVLKFLCYISLVHKNKFIGATYCEEKNLENVCCSPLYRKINLKIIPSELIELLRYKE